MSIEAAMVRSYFKNSKLSIGLSLKGNELRGPGYVRQKPAWSVVDGVAEAKSLFGPFSDSVEYDTVILLDGKDIVEEVHIGDSKLPPGSTCEHDFAITVGGVN